MRSKTCRAARACLSIAFASLFKPTFPNNSSRVGGSFGLLCRCELRLKPWLDATPSDFGPRQSWHQITSAYCLGELLMKIETFNGPLTDTEKTWIGEASLELVRQATDLILICWLCWVLDRRFRLWAISFDGSHRPSHQLQMSLLSPDASSIISPFLFDHGRRWMILNQ